MFTWLNVGQRCGHLAVFTWLKVVRGVVTWPCSPALGGVNWLCLSRCRCIVRLLPGWTCGYLVRGGVRGEGGVYLVRGGVTY